MSGGIRGWGLGVGLAAALMLAGCQNSDDDGAAAPTEPNPAGAEVVISSVDSEHQYGNPPATRWSGQVFNQGDQVAQQVYVWIRCRKNVGGNTSEITFSTQAAISLPPGYNASWTTDWVWYALGNYEDIWVTWSE